jgi:hypothetical protein
MTGLLATLVALGCLICFIIVLIKQFQDAGVVHGIIGIITFGVWTFIWGWINAARLNIKSIMMIWTLLIVVCLLANIVFAALMFRYAGATSTL